MTGKNVKGYRVVQKPGPDGKLKVTMERVPFYGRDSSAKIRMRNSKRVKVQHPMLAGLFTPKGKTT